jgi:hypothetical protein
MHDDIEGRVPDFPALSPSTIMIHSDDCRRADLDIFSTLIPLVLSEEYGAVITLQPSGLSKKNSCDHIADRGCSPGPLP